MIFKRSYFVDIQWLHFIGSRLDKFKTASASSNTFNCRCPICGDSDKSKSKARFYFYTKKGSLNTVCHNCGYSHSFWTFMKEVFPSDFEQYKNEQLKESIESIGSFSKPSRNVKKHKSYNPSRNNKKTLETGSNHSISGTKPLCELSETHKAVQYIKSRGFDERALSRLLWTDDFKEVAKTISHNPVSENFPSEGRIVIPFYDEEGNIEVVQGRALNNNSLRYITIKSSEDVDKVYGKYEVDRSKTVYCVEGPLDSLFIDNCIATCDSSLTSAKADVYAWDNEPRSREIVDLMEEAINNKKNVVIWDKSPNKKQDINDMILSGMTQKQLMKLIKKRTFSGLKAKLEFNMWRKV